jgi:hypothetical protein
MAKPNRRWLCTCRPTVYIMIGAQNHSWYVIEQSTPASTTLPFNYRSQCRCVAVRRVRGFRACRWPLETLPILRST